MAEARALFAGRRSAVSRHAPRPTPRTGADLVHLGPIWATPSKPGATPLGRRGAARAARGRRAWWRSAAIDSPARAREAAAAGADAIAAIRAAWAGDSLAAYVVAVDAGRAERSRLPA